MNANTARNLSESGVIGKEANNDVIKGGPSIGDFLSYV
jgi:hypothetical protein